MFFGIFEVDNCVRGTNRSGVLQGNRIFELVKYFDSIVNTPM